MAVGHQVEIEELHFGILESCFAHDLIRKPGSTFRDHALGRDLARA
jgi:hypothetical protein